MGEDLKLKKRCKIITLIAFSILTIMIIFKFSFFSSLPDKSKETCGFIFYIIIEILIWISSGIGASALTIVISKKFDYEFKKKVALKEYFNDAKTIFLAILNLKPFTPKNKKEAIDSFKNFECYLETWKKMIYNYDLMDFTSKDQTIKRTIDSVHDSFKDFLPSIIAPIYIIKYDPNCSALDYCNQKLFDIKLQNKNKPGLNIYSPLAIIKILPLLVDLEEKVKGTRTLDKNLPDFSITL